MGRRGGAPGGRLKSEQGRVARPTGGVVGGGPIGQAAGQPPWHELSYDLSRFAGKSVTITLENAADDWAWESAYWDSATVVTEE